MIEEIRRVNSSILGVVLNGIESVSGGYLRKSFREFYDYQTLPGQAVGAGTTSDLPPAPQPTSDQQDTE